MPKVGVDLWIYDGKDEERGLYLQKDFEIDFIPSIGMDFEPKLWTDNSMESFLLNCNEKKLLHFKITELLWSEIRSLPLSIVIEGKVTPSALNFLVENLTEIELTTDWGYTGFPMNPGKYFSDLRKEQEGMRNKKEKHTRRNNDKTQ
jgi:hypothetical protein